MKQNETLFQAEELRSGLAVRPQHTKDSDPAQRCSTWWVASCFMERDVLVGESVATIKTPTSLLGSSLKPEAPSENRTSAVLFHQHFDDVVILWFECVKH